MAKAATPRKTDTKKQKKTAADIRRKPASGSRGAPADAGRVKAILEALDRLYPDATCALHHRNAWELLVATILSAQCTDERVNMVTPALFARYPTPQAMAKARVEDVAEIVRSTGFFNNKAKNIVGAAKKIVEEFGGEVPREMEQLLTVPGAARKTANVVLGTAYGIASGVVVDTHVTRIAQRLELTREKTPEKIEQDLMRLLPQDRWILFSHQVIHFGRNICKARKPECGRCPLERICRAPDKTLP
ncbi:MAG: endonuclease III [Bryobacteraceae bacterium]|jgi:endonuclease-3